MDRALAYRIIHCHRWEKKSAAQKTKRCGVTVGKANKPNKHPRTGHNFYFLC